MRRRNRVVVLVVLAVVALAACGGDDDGGDDATTGVGDGGAPATADVTGTDGLTFEPEQLTVSAGTVTVELTAESGIEHTFVVEDVQGDEPVAEADAGATATGTVELEPGTYTFYCSVPGHREDGMEGTLTVE